MQDDNGLELAKAAHSLMNSTHRAALSAVLSQFAADGLSMILDSRPEDTAAREEGYRRVNLVRELEQYFSNLSNQHKAALQSAKDDADGSVTGV